MSNAIEMLKINDTGLLKPEQIEEFRTYLVGTGCKVRKGNNHGQLLFVGTSAGWAPLQKGANDTVKTPIALRPVINDFLKTPVARSMALAKRISQSKNIPLTADLARIVAGAVNSTPVHIPSDPLALANKERAEACTGSQTHEISISGPGHDFSSNLVARSEGDHIHSLTLSDRRISEPQTCAVVADEHSAVHAQSMCFSTPQGRANHRPNNFCVGPKEFVNIAAHNHINETAALAPGADPLHLEDLRDDFAIHCPLTQLENESLAAFADRRWKYADLMMQKRSPQYAD